MNEEEKLLLIQDLCEKFPYGLKCKSDVKSPVIAYCTLEKICRDVNGGFYVELKDRDFDGNALSSTGINDFSLVKPYLRPMSSMTEDEKKIYNGFVFCTKEYGELCEAADVDYLTNWLNRRLFDHRGLIEKNLAFEAPEDMYLYNQHA